MKIEGRPIYTLISGSVVAIACVLAVACDPGHVITFDNHTNRSAIVFEEQAESARLPANGTTELTVLTFNGTQTFSVRDEAGVVLYSAELTWDDLKNMNWTIVIEEAP